MCPKCWSGKYREKNQGEFPDKLVAPALRALLNAEIFTLEQLAEWSEKDLLELHGLGQSSLPVLREALKAKGLEFRK